MSQQLPNTNAHGHGDYERSDISVSGVLYFLLGLLVAVVAVYLLVNGLFSFLNKKYEAEQPPVSPLVTNAPQDTRRIPPQYGNDYTRYLKENFPTPQLETDERTELNGIRLREADLLSTYGYVDEKAGIVRIPVDRAMDILAHRGLPTRPSSGEPAAPAANAPLGEAMKGTPQ